MEMFREVGEVYLHREPVDFHKATIGLSVIVDQEMSLLAVGRPVLLTSLKMSHRLYKLGCPNDTPSGRLRQSS